MAIVDTSKNNTPTYAFYGGTHLRKTLERAASRRGLEVVPDHVGCTADVKFVAEDVEDHTSLESVQEVLTRVADDAYSWVLTKAVVVVSQVPPGFTRECADKYGDVPFYYQVDTIRMRDALERMVFPEQIVVGCADPSEPLPLAYQEYLLAFDCPVLQMSYESAELAKCAINAMLATQVMFANAMQEVADKLGASWEDAAHALRGDARVGPHAYLRPGGLNQHLLRDVRTLRELSGFHLPGSR